jgi:methionyl-tRNA formyltransferase
VAKPLQLVYCGTPQFAVPSLERLARDSSFHIALVVTQPDRPKGRGMELTASPVKQKALELGLLVTQPTKIKDNTEFRAQIEAIKPDAIIVVGYGRIIPKWMLELPRLGNINLHASLLPKYRGAAPIQWAIANGERETGNTTMLINEGLDTGDILLQGKTPIAKDDTALTLAPKLATSGAELLVRTLFDLDAGKITPRPQEDAQATLAPILKKDDGRIEFTNTAETICNRLRGFTPWPGAHTSWNGKVLNIHAAQVASEVLPHKLKTGEAIVHNGILLVGCGEGTLLAVSEVQMEGKKRMRVHDFLVGHKILPGTRLGE